MKNGKKGGTYLEVLISLVILLVVLNPLLYSLVYLKKGFNRLNEFNNLENEIEKIRSFYKNPLNINDYISLDKELVIDIKRKKIFEKIYELEIKIEKNNLRRESKLYVYKQK
ncbi:type II secretion system GspH family protein [Cetobacterium somerae]|uniref:type II secretion system protein n=1 Tax=Cetobacterium TaxID=180162 RepID=UPI001F0630F7|nr:type II secretion system protein [Cetobacterium somerae]MCX3068278.1 type II secretion system GspH family protein [Cetobacterium somerae]UPO97237.1 type II secretion system GspH family protein [Cetobacterium somerae]